MVDHPITDAVEDGVPVPKPGFRTAFINGVRWRVAAADTVRAADYSTWPMLDVAGIPYDRDTADTTSADSGGSAPAILVDSAGTRFRKLTTALYTGINPRGTYAGGTTYAKNDSVSYDGSSYVSIDDGNVGNQPDTSTSDWQLLSVGTPGADGDPGSSDVVGTSTTSLEIGMGSKAFTIVEADRGWGVGARLRASSDADPTDFMEGIVASYSGSALTLTVDLTGGSGTLDDWTINLAGEPGEDGENGTNGSNGAAGADGESFTWLGAYNAGTAYVENDVVSDQSSSWIALQATTGNAPPTLPTASNAHWELMAAKGADGAGGVGGFATKADAEAHAPAAAPDFLDAKGYTFPGDRGGSVFEKVSDNTEPSLPAGGKIQITLADAVTTAWYRSRPALVTPQMCGAVANGTTDDFQAFQDMFDWMAEAGLSGRIPAGSYLLEDEPDLDYTAASLTNKLGFSLRGDGPGCTDLIVDHAGAAINLISTSLAHAYGSIGGFRVSGATTRVGIGIKADNIPFVQFDDILAYALEYGFSGTDVLTMRFQKFIARHCLRGMLFDEQDSVSPPNNITLTDCTISECHGYGVRVVKGRLFRAHGLQIEAIGVSGSETDPCGIIIDEPQGPLAAELTGVYATNNKGLADILVNMGDDPATVAIHGGQFTRISSTNYVTNHIRVATASGEGDARCDIVLTGNAFQKLNTYTDDAGRPYVGVDGDGEVHVHDNGNFFESAAYKGAVDTHVHQLPYFTASKNGTNQTGVASVTSTKVTFTTEGIDEGGYYDAANSKWVPPAGKVKIVAQVTISAGAQDQGNNILQIYKNGSALRNLYQPFSGTGLFSLNAVIIDEADGNDEYEVYYFGTSAGTLTIDGNFARTFFMGTMLK